MHEPSLNGPDDTLVRSGGRASSPAALRGKHRKERAAMLAGSMVGFALIRVALASAEGSTLQNKSLKGLLVDSLAKLADDIA